MALEEALMESNSDPQDIPHPPDQQTDGELDLSQIALTYQGLAAVLDLREVARKGRSGEGSNQRTAEEEMVAMLNGLRRADHPTLPSKDVIEWSVSLLEDVLRVHLESDYDNEWTALQAGCQDVADQFGSMLSHAADDFERNREELEREGSTDPAILSRIEGFKNSVPYLRLAVSLVHQAGEPAAA
jgi:hypothetical protein